MAENSNIEWCKHTFNMWRGCTKASPACDMCYAEAMSVRNPGTLGVWGKYGTRVIAAESYWQQPLKWNRKAAEAGERHRVFCASLADVFEGEDTMPAEAVEPINAARKRLFKLIEQTHNLDWMLLTKRPENVMDMIPVRWKTACTFKGEPANKIPRNVWIGTTVENQKYADERIPELLNIPANVRFLSVEPMLGPVDLSFHLGLAENHEDLRGLINLVIAGGESGSKARPMHPDWPRSLRDQCVAAGVPFFFKQWGEYVPDSNAGSQTIDFLGKFQPLFPSPRDGAVEPRAAVRRIGKKQAGRLLDGRTWDQMPNDKSLPVHAL